MAKLAGRRNFSISATNHVIYFAHQDGGFEPRDSRGLMGSVSVVGTLPGLRLLGTHKIPSPLTHTLIDTRLPVCVLLYICGDGPRVVANY